MIPATTTPPSVKPAPVRRRRSIRLFLGIAAGVMLVLFGIYLYSELSTGSALAEAEAEARQDLPRWRLLEMEEDRPAIPDGENSALHMIAILRKGRVGVTGVPNYEEIFAKLPPNAQLNTQQEKIVRNELTRIAAQLTEARKLKDMPRGRFPIRYADDFISTLLPNHQEARQFADLLEHDAYLLAHDGEGDRALESCQAILNAGRALEGDLTLIACLIRIALQHRHVIALERVLAQTEPSEATLRELQVQLEKEARDKSWLQAVRGERAGVNHLFENIQNGKVSAAQMRGFGAFGVSPKVSTINVAIAAVYPRSVVKYYPAYLNYMNRTVEIAKLPFHERQLKMQAFEDECRETSNLLISSLAPALQKTSIAEARGQATVRTAAVALACERYRQAHKDAWPESLDALVPAKLLDAVPRDPFDGQPLRFRRTKEGVVIYSVGLDKKDDGGVIDHERMHQPGVDVGIRLWNVNQRRQAPLPPVVIEKKN